VHDGLISQPCDSRADAWETPAAQPSDFGRL
jgi:hypothetical protein